MAKTPPPLRYYQVKAVKDLQGTLSPRRRRLVLEAPTGSGKTRIITEVVRLTGIKSAGRCRVLFLAPRRELVRQARDRIAAHGIEPGVIMAGVSSNPERVVQVASFDTLGARAVRSSRIELPPANLIIVDECHLAASKERQAILAHYKDAWMIGLSATPARPNGQGLEGIFDAIVPGPSVTELTEHGFLVPLRYFAPSAPDLERIKLDRNGDYQAKEIGQRMDRAGLIGNIVGQWKRIAEGRSTVVFCTNRRHALNVCAAFRKAKVRAEEVDAKTPLKEREAILARIESGETTVLVNVLVASYGIDIPRLSCAVLARPTRSITLYRQALGRIMRPCPEIGKEDGVVIDHAGAVADNGFADDDVPWTLAGGIRAQDRLLERKERRHEPKPITCPHCHTVFTGQRECPRCGAEVLAANQPIPVYEADLEEVVRKLQRKRNREYKAPDKRGALGTFEAYGKAHSYKRGWAVYRYREFFGVNPTGPIARNAGEDRTDEAAWEFAHQQIVDYAKRQAKSNPRTPSHDDSDCFL